MCCTTISCKNNWMPSHNLKKLMKLNLLSNNEKKPFINLKNNLALTLIKMKVMLTGGI